MSKYLIATVISLHYCLGEEGGSVAKVRVESLSYT